MNLIIPALDLPRAPAISATSTLTGFGFLNITPTQMSEENTANFGACFLISNLTIFSRVWLHLMKGGSAAKQGEGGRHQQTNRIFYHRDADADHHGHADADGDGCGDD